MMMLFAAILGACLLNFVGAQKDACDVNLKIDNSVTELDPPGTEILNISAGQDVNWTMSIDYSAGLNNVQGQLDPYLTLDREASTGNFVLKVQRTLDLEQIFADLKFDVFLNVEPVNEFEPEFQSRIINVNISEHEGLATTLIVLASVASDRDVNPTTNEIHGFSFQPYDYARFNGKPGVEDFNISEDFRVRDFLTRSDSGPVNREVRGQVAPVNPAANVPLNLNVPFNLNLLPAEREARNQVQNPNDNVPARNAGGGGQILYAPDEADDVDDEDPDEDLDF